MVSIKKISIGIDLSHCYIEQTGYRRVELVPLDVSQVRYQYFLHLAIYVSPVRRPHTAAAQTF